MIAAVLLTPSGLTRLVERLERDVFVTRVRSDDDPRGAYATLTDGEDGAPKAWRRHDEYEDTASGATT